MHNIDKYKKQLAIVLEYISNNYSVLRPSLTGNSHSMLNLNIFFDNIFKDYEDELGLREQLLKLEGDFQVQDFETNFELNEWLIANIEYQEKAFDINSYLEKLNTHAQERIIKEGKIDIAVRNLIEAKIISSERKKNNNANEKNDQNGYIYVIKSDYGYKIGKTKNIKQRNKLFSVKLPFNFEYVLIKECKNYHNVEMILHNTFFEKHLNGEWFDLLNSDLIKIESIIEENGI